MFSICAKLFAETVFFFTEMASTLLLNTPYIYERFYRLFEFANLTTVVKQVRFALLMARERLVSLLIISHCDSNSIQYDWHTVNWVRNSILGVFSTYAKTISFSRNMAVLLNTPYIYERIETFLSVVRICKFDHCRETG